MNSTLKTRLAGALGLVLLVGAIGVALGAYQQVFTKTVDISVTSDRAGLLLDPGAKVQAFGLTVGEVRSVDLLPDNSVRVKVALEPDSVKNIPRDVTANVGASTVFGAKFIKLNVPEGPVPSPIRADDVIAADRVTSEANDLFEDLDEVLTAVQPEQLNTTLSSIATSLDGRGRKLGTYFTDVDSYVEALNDNTDDLTEVIDRSASVLNLYADTADEFLDIGRNASITSDTLAGSREDLGASLRGVGRAADIGTDFLGALAEPLDSAMSDLEAPLDLLGEFRPVIECTLVALGHHQVDAGSLGGLLQPGVQGEVSFLPAQDGYKYPQNLPKFEDNQGPDCYGLSRETFGIVTGPDGKPDYSSKKGPEKFFQHEYFEDGSEGIYKRGGGVGVDSNPVVVYTELVETFFGNAGLTRLIGGEDQE